MRIKINEIEKQRILEMHNSKKNQLINEQETAAAPADVNRVGTQGGLRGALNRVGTSVRNVKAAATGNLQNIKDPELEATLTRFKTNSKQTLRQLTDTYNNLRDLLATIDKNKIEPINQDELTQLQTQVTNYMKAIKYAIDQTTAFNNFQIKYNNNQTAAPAAPATGAPVNA